MSNECFLIGKVCEKKQIHTGVHLVIIFTALIVELLNVE